MNPVAWVAVIFTAYLALVAVVARCMAQGVPTPKPPTTVRDPETGAIWTETRRVDTYA